ncbi:hypothetical protein VC885_24530 [Citrobacter freundii]|uniref:hypothetical protein n=1 Tax=Citrobacter freundii TaxID=546 RepID=UPI0029351FE2|nr:hypothetical protein [Citrobacter freundii]MDV2277155.1 hypothetical protein [Citrobacter freundii]MEB0857347.1 hypothetical protein [Citrobacter freundii]
MVIFEIIRPGTWLDSDDKDWRFRITAIIDQLTSSFFEANIALNKFTELNEVQIPSHDERLATFYRDSDKLSEIRKKICEETGLDEIKNGRELHFLTERRFNIERWTNGEIPETFKSYEIHIYAKAFLFSLDTIVETLKKLASEPGVPVSLSKIRDDALGLFPDLRQVRNSAHHLEDRVRFIGDKLKPIKIKPFETQTVKSTEQAMVIGMIEGNNYGFTKGDGKFASIPISSETLTMIQKVVQDVYEAFEWKGIKEHMPR